ncbi:multisubunit sodium/proton antiporter, MrpG subunit [Marinobacter sp. es.042]|uniref:monovalent cation/H(+) antiporter subunit G n=1 Tax=Marinobacter sp. es.042 TaxID=1761794 RepID=UPI000B503840|nr:monovalent cation/H(+) antiporter subunit G [Marinobacter sp. es.042]SNB54600.1 multisubunit sodium/proton antiporter, MrpG subunit [Marinobacter sp. es.042]
MTEVLVSVLLLAGASFMVLAAIGILRLPDLPTRMHATTKAGALGAMLTMGGVAFYFADSTVVARAIAIVVFILLTAPIAAHVIGRAGYFTGIELWEGTVKDELRERYDSDSHELRSGLDTSEEKIEPQKEEEDRPG